MSASDPNAPAAGAAAATESKKAEEPEVVYPDLDPSNKEYLNKLVEAHGFPNVINAIADEYHAQWKAEGAVEPTEQEKSDKWGLW